MGKSQTTRRLRSAHAQGPIINWKGLDSGKASLPLTFRSLHWLRRALSFASHCLFIYPHISHPRLLSSLLVSSLSKPLSSKCKSLPMQGNRLHNAMSFKFDLGPMVLSVALILVTSIMIYVSGTCISESIFAAYLWLTSAPQYSVFLVKSTYNSIRQILVSGSIPPQKAVVPLDDDLETWEIVVWEGTGSSRSYGDQVC